MNHRSRSVASACCAAWPTRWVWPATATYASMSQGAMSVPATVPTKSNVTATVVMAFVAAGSSRS